MNEAFQQATGRKVEFALHRHEPCFVILVDGKLAATLAFDTVIRGMGTMTNASRLSDRVQQAIRTHDAG